MELLKLAFIREQKNTRLISSSHVERKELTQDFKLMQDITIKI